MMAKSSTSKRTGVVVAGNPVRENIMKTIPKVVDLESEVNDAGLSGSHTSTSTVDHKPKRKREPTAEKSNILASPSPYNTRQRVAQLQATLRRESAAGSTTTDTDRLSAGLQDGETKAMKMTNKKMTQDGQKPENKTTTKPDLRNAKKRKIDKELPSKTTSTAPVNSDSEERGKVNTASKKRRLDRIGGAGSSSGKNGESETATASIPEVAGRDFVPLLMNVISNSVIIRRLEEYISYEDIKTCRLVCRTFNQSIIEESKFSNRTKLIVKEYIFHSEIFSQLSFQLKNVDLYLFSLNMPMNRKLSKEQPNIYQKLEPMYQHFEKVESLKIYDDLLPKKISGELLPDVSRLIRTTESLKELKLNALDLRVCLSSEDHPGLVNKLKDVVVLHLSGKAPSDIKNFPNGMMAGCLREMNNLKVFRVQDDSTRTRVKRFHSYGRKKLLPEFLDVIARNENSLTSFSIGEPYIWQPIKKTHDSNIQFSNLQEVYIRVKEDQAADVCNFLGTHIKQLDSLSIRVLGEFQSDILDIIRTQGNKKLKRLNIAATTLGKNRKPNLAFLEDFHDLENFQLKFIFSWVDPTCVSIPEVFGFMPTQKLQHLALSHGATILSRLDREKIEALSGLTSLTLDHCGDAVDDDTLNSIFKNMTQLEYLRITYTLNTGIRGFTGAGSTKKSTPDPGKVAASNLTKLKKLSLINCGVNDHIVEVAFKFRNLELLDIRRNLSVTKLSCKVAFDQNPSLRLLQIGPIYGSFKNWKRNLNQPLEGELKFVRRRYASSHKSFAEARSRFSDPSDDDPDDDSSAMRMYRINHALEKMSRRQAHY